MYFIFFYIFFFFFFVFFFNDTATTEIYTLSLHDALPILLHADRLHVVAVRIEQERGVVLRAVVDRKSTTSELQSRENLVCRLLLEKKKKQKKHTSLTKKNKKKKTNKNT